MRPGKGRRPILSLLLAPVILGCALVAYFALEGAGDLPAVAAEPAMDCGDGSQVDHAAFLFDLRKPLDAVHATLPGALFRQAAHAMDAGTELAVYTLSPHAEAPRTLIGRLCKTFDDAGLTAESSKHLATDDCDIPAQVPAALRASAKDFCRRRDALARRIDALVVETFGQAAGAAYLVEALEATARDFGETAGSLHVFSDLVQHAAWFSHAESPLEEWEFERMASAWTALPLEEALRGFPPETSVRIHYVPRTGTTELEEWRATHKRFWQAYFGGTDLQFDDQPTMAEYTPLSLTAAPNAMELAAYELERLRHSNALVEKDRATIERERRDLERERRGVEAERQRLEAERQELAAERERLTSQQARLASSNDTADGLGEGT